MKTVIRTALVAAVLAGWAATADARIKLTTLPERESVRIDIQNGRFTLVEEELAQMVALLRTSLDEGGMGFSSTISSTHNDAEGNPVPSRHASRDEMLTLARQVRDFEGTTVEFLPGVGWGEEAANYMADLSLAANRPTAPRGA